MDFVITDTDSKNRRREMYDVMKEIEASAEGPRPMSMDRSRSSRRALALFMVVVLGHWAEHLFQAFQIWGLGWPPDRALGALGLVAPDLVRSEWLHWSYNLFVFGGIVFLSPAFDGPARRWWGAAGVTQGWHFAEHMLLLVQASIGKNLLGAEAPTSLVQLVVPRVELHLFYNAIVTGLMVVGLVLLRPGIVHRRGPTPRVA